MTGMTDVELLRSVLAESIHVHRLAIEAGRDVDEANKILWNRRASAMNREMSRSAMEGMLSALRAELRELES